MFKQQLNHQLEFQMYPHRHMVHESPLACTASISVIIYEILFFNHGEENSCSQKKNRKWTLFNLLFHSLICHLFWLNTYTRKYRCFCFDGFTDIDFYMVLAQKHSVCTVIFPQKTLPIWVCLKAICFWTHFLVKLLCKFNILNW